jgi:ERF superfamily
VQGTAGDETGYFVPECKEDFLSSMLLGCEYHVSFRGTVFPFRSGSGNTCGLSQRKGEETRRTHHRIHMMIDGSWRSKLERLPNQEIDMQTSKARLKVQDRSSLNEAHEAMSVDAGATEPVTANISGKGRDCLAKASGRATAVDPKVSVEANGTQASIVHETSPVQSHAPGPMTLRQKLGEVRRRIGYIQKRGYNERHNYNYVAAADIAGAVGDVLAELGVVVIPRLESITYEAPAPGRVDSVRVARVIMAYSFTDVDSGEEITAKVAGEGLDVGDKASYKAMTGALKYALLQSFLLATGDDPEDERVDSRTGSRAESLITAEQAGQLQRLIDETGTELERVLAYYKVAELGEMSEASYQRALELLKRKLDKQGREAKAHAQN